ncbi:MAG: SGNH/GDSL hydrolase family protein [Burkholderiales bacterium]|nr:MAG: SGNH/GDSL hydrolase family protein [Burkholderiales bacterium]
MLLDFSRSTKLSLIAGAFAALACVPALAADCGNKDMKCLVVIGNSITRHGPAEELDWRGDWGMAASSADKDFVSQLLKQLQAKPGGRWAVRKEGGFELEGNPAGYRVPNDLARVARGAELVVLEVGDNLDAKRIGLPTFVRGYADAARALRPANGKLICVGVWWSNPDKDTAIKNACAQAGGVFVDLADVSSVAGNSARSERSIAHEGVGSHPGDAGMRAIASKIHQAFVR